jgi:endonuclease YncB( thermonuclease family)
MAALAASPWDGTWKVDVSTAQMPKKPDVFLLQDGTYECKTCVPAENVKADGADHAIAGNPYIDSFAIKIVGDHTIKETDKKGGKTVATSTVTIAADGKTGMVEFTGSSNSNAAPVTGNANIARVADGPKGSHVTSGSWRTENVSGMSGNSLTVTFKTDGDTLMMSSPTGQSYTVKMDGTDAPMKGDPGITTVSVKKVGKNALEETDKRNGKVVSVETMTMSGEGKTITVKYENKERGTSMSFKEMKQ